MVTRVGTECNSQQSVGFEGEPGVPNDKTKVPNFGIYATIGSRDICILVYMRMYSFMFLLACINGIMDFSIIFHIGI